MAPFTVVALVGGGAFSLTGSGAQLSTEAILITAIGSIIATTLTAPVRSGIDALLYVDLRMRKEGLDLVLQQQALGAPPPAVPPQW